MKCLVNLYFSSPIVLLALLISWGYLLIWLTFASMEPPNLCIGPRLLLFCKMDSDHWLPLSLLALGADCNQQIFKQCFDLFQEVFYEYRKWNIFSRLFIFSVQVALCLLACRSVPCNGHESIAKYNYNYYELRFFWNVNCLAPRIVACLRASILVALCDSMLESLDRSLSLPKVNSGAERVGDIFPVMGKILSMQRSLPVVLSQLWTAKF